MAQVCDACGNKVDRLWRIDSGNEVCAGCYGQIAAGGPPPLPRQAVQLLTLPMRWTWTMRLGVVVAAIALASLSFWLGRWQSDATGNEPMSNTAASYQEATKLGVGAFCTIDGTLIHTKRIERGWYRVAFIELTLRGNQWGGTMDANGSRHGYWSHTDGDSPLAPPLEWWYWHDERVSQAEFLRRSGSSSLAQHATRMVEKRPANTR